MIYPLFTLIFSKQKAAQQNGFVLGMGVEPTLALLQTGF